MATGMEMLFGSILKNLPDDIKKQIEAVGQISVTVKAQMDRIEAQQVTLNYKLNLILTHFGIGVPDEIDPGNSGGSGTDIQKRN